MFVTPSQRGECIKQVGTFRISTEHFATSGGVGSVPAAEASARPCFLLGGAGDGSSGGAQVTQREHVGTIQVIALEQCCFLP